MKLVKFLDLLHDNGFVKSDNLYKDNKCYWMINLSERVPPDKWEDFNLFETYQVFVSYHGFIFTRSVNYLYDFDFLYSTYEYSDGMMCEAKSGTYEGNILSAEIFQKFFLRNIDLFNVDQNCAIVVQPLSLFLMS